MIVMDAGSSGSQIDYGLQQRKTVELLLLCEQSTAQQVSLLSVAMETGNPFLPVVAASCQVRRFSFAYSSGFFSCHHPLNWERG